MSRRDEIYARKRADFLAAHSSGTPQLLVGETSAGNIGGGGAGTGDPGLALEAAWNASRARDPPAPYIPSAYKIADEGAVVASRDGAVKSNGYRVSRPPGRGGCPGVSRRILLLGYTQNILLFWKTLLLVVLLDRSPFVPLHVA